MPEEQVFVKVKAHGKKQKIGITKKYFRARQFDPSKCQPDSFVQLKNDKTGHGLVLCKPKGEEKLKPQSILHPRTEAERKKLGIPKKALRGSI